MLQTRMDERWEIKKINFNNFQMQNESPKHLVVKKQMKK